MSLAMIVFSLFKLFTPQNLILCDIHRRRRRRSMGSILTCVPRLLLQSWHSEPEFTALFVFNRKYDVPISIRLLILQPPFPQGISSSSTPLENSYYCTYVIHNTERKKSDTKLLWTILYFFPAKGLLAYVKIVFQNSKTPGKNVVVKTFFSLF